VHSVELSSLKFAESILQLKVLLLKVLLLKVLLLKVLLLICCSTAVVVQ
jgi:hypothetical protein